MDGPPEVAGADEVLEWAARLIEDVSLSDFAGIWAKRKRDREDAQLKLETAQEIRKRCAAHIRAFKSRSDLGTVAVLRRIADLGDKGGHIALLRDAWPLAWKGLCKIECRIMASSNSIPPPTDYHITLTDRGKAMLPPPPDPAPDRRQTMKLWLISQNESRGYDVFDSAVVAAEDEDAAKATHPADIWGRGDWRSGIWCKSPEAVTARLIREAVAGTPPGVICASFNAG